MQIINMKISFFIILLLTTVSAFSHEIKLENKVAEDLINNRMKIMNNINKLSQNIYKQLNLKDFDLLNENTLKLKHAATDFNKLFPINSRGGKAKDLIWENRILFDEYNDNFLNDINLMLINIKEKKITLLKKSFNKMAANCSSCHKKFKNKK